jgi:tRNA 2-thiouridine synthesizing protein A
MDRQMGSSKHDRLVDCIGLKCPLPVLRARKALQQAAVGAVLRVETTDPMALIDVPNMVREDGHEMMDQQVEGARATFLIRRGSASDRR